MSEETSNPSGASDWILFVQMRQPVPALLHDFFPPGNRIATSLLAGWIAERLSTRGLLTTEGHGAGGPLENASLVFSVTDPVRASAEIKVILEKIGHLETAQIGYWDPVELVIRTLHPRKGDLMALPLKSSFAEQALADSVSDDLQQAIARARAKETGGDAP